MDLQLVTAVSFALGANISFSIASVLFTEFSRKVTPLWMNCLKSVFTLFVCLACLLFIQSSLIFNLQMLMLLSISGFIGLCIGDLFMLKAMSDIGAARMVMMFGLTPFLTGLGSLILFSTHLPLKMWIGVGFMILCLFFLCFERFKTSGKWHVRGFTWGLIAVFLDACGLLISKYSFTEFSSLHPFQVNFHRSLGAVIGFIFIHFFYKKINLYPNFIALKKMDKSKVLVASFLGTFLSLFLFMKAISLGHLSVVSSVAGTGPLFSQVIESTRDKKWPHILWWLAFTCMLIGFGLFTLG